MKSIALLATALFLASAPSPDSDTISQLSAGFLLAGNVQPLMAAESELTLQQVQTAVGASATLTSATTVEDSHSQSDLPD